VTVRARSLLGLGLGLALLTGRATAFDVSGMLSAAALRTDTWDASTRTASPSWDAGGSIAFSDLPINHAILDLTASADYRRYQSVYDSGSSTASGLAYNAAANVARGSWLPWRVGVSRSTNDFTTSTSGGTGTTLSQREAVGTTIYSPGLPLLSGSLTRADIVNRSFLAPEVRTGATSLSAALSQSLDMMQYGASYDTTWSDGAFTETNYRLHNFTFEGTARPTKELEAHVTDRYVLRLPTSDSPFNPRVDQQALGTGLTWRGTDKLSFGTSYAYAHSVTDAPGSASQEVLTHGVSTSGFYRYRPSLGFTLSAGANFGVARNGTEEQRISGQQVGAGAQWSHESSGQRVQLDGGASVGAVEPRPADVQLAYGANGGVSYNRPIGQWSGALSYSIGYSSGLGGLVGSSFTQSLSASSSGRLGKIQTSASASASASRAGTPLLGTSFSRAASLSGGASYQRWHSELLAGLSDGLSEALRGPGLSDGLFLSPAFNTHSRFVTLSFTYKTFYRLEWSAVGRYLESTSPGRPKQWERGGSLVVNFPYGLFMLSIEDRISQGGTGDTWTTGNAMFVRVSRAFGARF